MHVRSIDVQQQDLPAPVNGTTIALSTESAHRLDLDLAGYLAAARSAAAGCSSMIAVHEVDRPLSE
jgi:hypothetical protein